MNWRKWLYRLPLAWRETVLRRETERELDDELAFHLEMQIAANRAQGMNPKQARYAALRQFDGLEQRKEECRDARKMNWLDDLIGDTGYALRMLRKRPAFSAIAILSLAIGIGANAALFSVVDAVVLHPVPLADADRLVVVDELKDGHQSGGNAPRTYDWGAYTPAFESVTGYYSEDLVLTGQGDAVKLSALRTCGDPVRTLNIQPSLGRGFTVGEQHGQGAPVAMISDDLWRRMFRSDPAALGRMITLSGKGFTVIGVLPRGLIYPDRIDLWAPMSPDLQTADRRGSFGFTVARVKPGVTKEEVQAQLRVVAARLALLYPATDKGRTATAYPLGELKSRRTRGPVLILWGTALVVLLLACVNFASLLLSRSLTRQREASIRMALGAGRMRLVRLYLSESMLIALLGGLVGLGTASLTLNFLVKRLPAELPNLASVSLNPRVIVVTFGLSLLCGLFAGWIPAWRIAGTASGEGLHDRDAIATQRSQWLQKGLLACQVSLSVVLLTGAVLLTRSLMKLASEPLGFRPENVLTVNIDHPWDTPQHTLVSFYSQAIDGFSKIPGVRAVGMVDRLPLRGGSQGRTFRIRNRPISDGRASGDLSLRAIAGDYFGAIGIPLLAGRNLSGRVPEGIHEAVVNQAFAKQYFPGETAVGQAILFTLRIDEEATSQGKHPSWYEIVGVVGDVRQETTQPAPAEVYIPAKDTYWPLQVYVLRATGDPRTLPAGVRQIVRRIDPAQFIDRIATMEETVHSANAQPRLRAQVFGAFAVVALLLTALGIYGLQAQTVAQRTKEIGVRIALGARPVEASRMILRQNLLVVSVGLAMGILGAALLTGLLKSLLYSVSALDPIAFVIGAVGLLVTTALASYLPAKRAASVDPVIALRHD